MKWAFGAVAVCALVCLLIRASRVGLAGDYIDPVTKITAQDEALYAHSAIRMATRGGWLTPMFMGRYALYKPPLLIWAAGFSARVLGISRLALRVPVALLSSLALGLVFLWAAEMQGWVAGACAAVLVASNHLWHVLGSMCMTDGLLVAFFVAAMYCLFSDPWLESRWALWGFAASIAAGLLTKGIAGVLPLAVFGLYWIAAPRKQRPALGRACIAVGLAAALTAPWFVYQMTVHGRWFWMEHVRVEIFGFGVGAPPQTSKENRAMFYVVRVALTDPLLAALAFSALPPFLSEVRRRSGGAVLVFCWTAVVLLAVMGWQYRNISYLLPLVPALAIMATAFGPLFAPRYARWMLPVAAAAFAVKVAMPAEPWGLSFHRGTVQPDAPLLSNYCEQRRGNELIVIGMDDDLYAAALPLAKLRYGLVARSVAAGKYGMPFDEMGIVLTASQFNDLDHLEPVFRGRLRQWGLDSGEPVGTLIVAASREELAETIRAHPDTDFLIAAKDWPVAAPQHDVVKIAGHVWLLAKQAMAWPGMPRWTCGL